MAKRDVLFALALALNACVIIMLSSAVRAKESKELVRVGDLVFEFPFQVSFDPRSTTKKTKFDYGRELASGSVRNVDVVFIKLEQVLPEIAPGIVFSLTAANNASDIDNLCGISNRLGKVLEPSEAVRTDGNFYVYREKPAAADIYVSKDSLLAFGAPFAARRWLAPSLRKIGSTEERFLFSVALTAKVYLLLRVGAEVVPRDKLSSLVSNLEHKLRSWLVEPSSTSIHWYHEKNQCVSR
jgi:hypothetical protein